jgi:exopolyphosphatase/guanosine-5'-triphosphate,3'-diphosphate pyrophosphatase
MVIDGDEEARLAFRSVENAFDLSMIDSAVVDIGGGSTEIVLASRGVITEVVSVPIGAVRLTARFCMNDNDNGAGFYAMREYVKDVVQSAIRKPVVAPSIVFGTGGTFTNMATVAMHRTGGASSGKRAIDIPSIRGYEITRSDVLHIMEMLRKLPADRRAGVPGLSPDRADIIIAGVVIVDRVLKHLGANRLRVHDRGLRDGIILDMLEEIDARPTAQHRQRISRPAAARRFGVACRYEEHHCEHVARLALQLFDQVVELTGSADEPWATSDSRELLEAAALLHDIGYLVNYTKHHKHSYHLIVHSEMPAFTHRELEIVANVARYHRRACPKTKHKPFKHLCAEDRETVRALSAFLRIADGLDRTHAQHAHSVRVVFEQDCARFQVGATEEPAVDIWGAERKADLFHDFFHTCPRFEWVRSTDPVAAPGLPASESNAHPIRSMGETQADTR